MKVLLKLFVCFLFFIQSNIVFGDVTLPSVIGNNMVLQQNKPIQLWGWAEPGESVSIEINNNKEKTKTDDNGKWNITMPAMKAGGPFKMEIKGNNTIELTNVLVGEVWICSGQSNMEWSMRTIDNNVQEILQANNPNIRLFHIPKKAAAHAQKDVDAEWEECNSSTVINFSSVAYFFGKNLNQKLDVPVGLIETAWGGTRIEPWTPPVGFNGIPELADIVTEIEQSDSVYNAELGKSLTELEKWTKEAREAFNKKSDMPDMPKLAEHPLAYHQKPTSLYNGMVHGIVPYTFQGAIWYQGESNRNDGMLYYEMMMALINGWRKVWDQGSFPFYYVQLAPYSYSTMGTDAEGEMRLPIVREAQRKALQIPNTGMIVTTDIGNIYNIHPQNKQETSRRLALWALAKTYGQKDIVFSGPLYESIEIKDDRILVNFKYADNGLQSSDGKPLDWFEIAGSDNIFVQARAFNKGNQVEVWSDQVKSPVAVRFGWHETAEPNLINTEGLPASPFNSLTK